VEKKDITVMIGEHGFNFRVAAIIECEGKMLLHKPENWDFWNLPGGRVKCGEQTLSAIKRELKEELGVTIEELKLVEVSENFFAWQGKPAHELLFVYKIVVSPDHELYSKQDFPSLDHDDMVYHWFEKDEIKNYKCLPELIYKWAERNDFDFEHCSEINPNYYELVDKE
jgi:ADP-ribose pyrophosphatase YjhB (NUDIX family)